MHDDFAGVRIANADHQSRSCSHITLVKIGLFVHRTYLVLDLTTSDALYISNSRNFSGVHGQKTLTHKAEVPKGNI